MVAYVIDLKVLFCSPRGRQLNKRMPVVLGLAAREIGIQTSPGGGWGGGREIDHRLVSGAKAMNDPPFCDGR